MGLSEVFDKLSEKVMPLVADKVFPDLLDVMRSESVSDGKGGQRKSVAEEANRYSIPCIYEPKGVAVKDVKSGEWSSRLGYAVKMPRVYRSSRIDVTTGDRLKILERGIQPEMLLKIEAIKSFSGVYLEVLCIEESV